ncbi:MAG: ClpXP protease specificity-enhancing factor [Gammaproteobacteria bacterium]
MAEKLKSTRPYLLRAFYEWILDNQMTPHVLVDATRDNVVVPARFVKNGKIVLNISPGAVRDLHIEQASMRFNGRFAGEPFEVWLPVAAIEAIYSRENGKGLVFSPEPGDGSDTTQPPKPSRPNLKLVK